MTGDTAEELERFRQQWQEEVSARSKRATSASKATRPARPSHRTSGKTGLERASGPAFHKPFRDTEDADDSGHHDHHILENKDEARKLGEAGGGIYPGNQREPSSALEHYERAVEREAEGSLGDSMNHYRKAYRLDAGVDHIYRHKHFPPSSFGSKPTKPNPSSEGVTIPNPAHHSLDGPPASTTSDLIASFSSVSILPTESPTDASLPPLCPVSRIPPELLVNILLQTAILDVASFVHLSLVCKRLAYLVATEERIWNRVCLGLKVGFRGMHYKWTRTISGDPLPISVGDLDENLSANFFSLTLDLPPANLQPLALSDRYPSYKRMLQIRPRIRFNGCYISTVNYIRPGGNTASQSTWNTPVHIVTYYRYLRFFRDGTCASLLTTTEPNEVVHYLTKENMHTQHAGGLPSSVMNNSLRGRWKLSGDPYDETSHKPSNKEEKEEEGTLHIETEGADAVHPNPKYIYKMILALKSAGRGSGATRNNKLAWMGYWSYNKLTDDWAEFGLKNDKAFFWSRVKSYGSGE